MCIFSRRVDRVADTRIFARVAGHEQVIVYEMTFAALGDLAMVLPIPVRPGEPENATRFVNLERYPKFFDDLERLFPQPPATRSLSLGRGPPPATTSLVVHDVGAFEASYVPTIRDFARLDERFRVAPATWDALPAYRDFGFAVFKLRGESPGDPARRAGAKRVHPMAFAYPTRDARTLFFPTVHIHDGTVHATADFDHTLYSQARVEGWTRSATPPEGTMALDRAAGLLEPRVSCYRNAIHGDAPNQDVIVRVG